MCIVRRGVDQLFSVELFEVVWKVIDHVIAIDHGFAAAEYKLLPGHDKNQLAPGYCPS